MLNITSLLSYIPLCYYCVYSATKIVVLSLTETLAAEFEGAKVEIKALCTGPVATEFNTTEMKKTNVYKANKPIPQAKWVRLELSTSCMGRKVKKLVLIHGLFQTSGELHPML